MLYQYQHIFNSKMTVWLSHTIRWEISMTGWRVSTHRLKTAIWYPIVVRWVQSTFYSSKCSDPFHPKKTRETFVGIFRMFPPNPAESEARYVSRCRAKACSACPNGDGEDFDSPAVDPKSLHAKSEMGCHPFPFPNPKIWVLPVCLFLPHFWLDPLNNTIWTVHPFVLPSSCENSVGLHPTNPTNPITIAPRV